MLQGSHRRVSSVSAVYTDKNLNTLDRISLLSKMPAVTNQPKSVAFQLGSSPEPSGSPFPGGLSKETGFLVRSPREVTLEGDSRESTPALFINGLEALEGEQVIHLRQMISHDIKGKKIS